jgi:hypothetical protein
MGIVRGCGGVIRDADCGGVLQVLQSSVMVVRAMLI